MMTDVIWRLLFTLLCWPLAALAQLPAEIGAALDRAKLPHDAISIVVHEVGTRQARLAWQDERSVNPASLMKIPTTLAALDMLGPAWTWQTPVWLVGRIESGVLDGDVVIQGSGDPKLVQERLWLLLRRVQQQGVREIRGDIVLDRAGFDVPAVDPGDFDGEPLRAYNVQPDALLVNFKSQVFTFTPDAARGVATIGIDPPLAGLVADATVPLAQGPCDDWRKSLRADFSNPLRPRFAGVFAVACGERAWPIAAADPRGFNGRAIAGMWRELGGTLRGTVRDGVAPAGLKPSFEFASPPLAEVVREINKFSNNVMARQLFLTLGRNQRGTGSAEVARMVVGEWLATRIGADAAGFVLDNGAGLSREARATARGFDALLQSAWASPSMPEFVASLPLAGTDGTMRRSRAGAGRAHLKTGSLRDVAAVAGYVLGSNGRRHVLVAVINHPGANDTRAVFDALIAWTAADAGN